MVQLHWLYSELEDQQVAPPTKSLYDCKQLWPTCKYIGLTIDVNKSPYLGMSVLCSK